MKLSFGGETRRPAAGFTLLEVIVSAGISVVLVYAIYRSVAMHHLQIQTGREIAEGAQLVRGVFRQIRADLRATFVGYTPSGESAGQSNGSTSDSTASTTTSASAGGTASIKDEYDVPAGGVLGATDSITAVVRVAPAELDFTRGGSLDVGVPPMSDLRIVRYRMANETAEDGTVRSGLVRELLSRIPDAETNSDSFAWSRIDLLAPEVCSMTILYYDGIEWTTTWDTDITKAPQAIDITLGIVNPNQKTTTAGDQPQSDYRLVIALTDTGRVEAAQGGGSPGSNGSTGQSSNATTNSASGATP